MTFRRSANLAIIGACAALVLGLCGVGLTAWAEHGDGFEETIIRTADSTMQAGWWGVFVQLGGLGFAGAALVFVMSANRKLGAHLESFHNLTEDVREVKDLALETRDRVARVEGQLVGIGR